MTLWQGSVKRWAVRGVCGLACCLAAGCTSSSRLANPLGLDFDPLLRRVDQQRPVPVVYPAGASRPSLVEAYGSEWERMPHGYPAADYERKEM